MGFNSGFKGLSYLTKMVHGVKHRNIVQEHRNLRSRWRSERSSANRNSVYISSTIDVHTGSSVEIQTPNTPEPTAACVITQQYSSTTFVSLRFHSRTRKLGARFKHVISGFILLFFTFFKLGARFKHVISGFILLFLLFLN